MSKLIDLSQMKEVCLEFLSIADLVTENVDMPRFWWDKCFKMVQQVIAEIEKLENE